MQMEMDNGYKASGDDVTVDDMMDLIGLAGTTNSDHHMAQWEPDELHGFLDKVLSQDSEFFNELGQRWFKDHLGGLPHDDL